MNETVATVMQMVVDGGGLHRSLGIRSSTQTLKMTPVGFVSETTTYLRLLALQLRGLRWGGDYPLLGFPG